MPKRRSSHCLIAPVRRAYPGRGHNTAGRYYRSLMYIRLHPSDTLHKKPYCIRAGLRGTSANRVSRKFALPDVTKCCCSLHLPLCSCARASPRTSFRWAWWRLRGIWLPTTAPQSIPWHRSGRRCSGRHPSGRHPSGRHLLD